MSQAASEEIGAQLIDQVCARLAADQPVRRKLPGGGSLSIDRQLPFLTVYRRDPDSEDAGTSSFVSHEAAYLSAPGSARVRKGLKPLIRRLVEGGSRRYGGFLILEVRSGPGGDDEAPAKLESGELELPRPGFRIHGMSEHPAMEVVNSLRDGLEKVRANRQPAEVTIDLNEPWHAPGLKPLLSARLQEELDCRLIGVEIRPIYRDERGRVLPDVLEQLRRSVSRVLKKAFYAFALHHTELRPHHYYALGRRSIPQSTWRVDHRLSEIGGRIDLILSSTPVNAQSAWRAFESEDYRHEPIFQTRPLPFDPLVLKRELLEVPTERVDDPTLAHLFRQVQEELDRQLTMLLDLGSQRFLYGSLQVFGGVESPLLELAESLLALTAKPRSGAMAASRIGPQAFARRARAEVAAYQKLDPRFRATVELRQDLFSGLMVSGTQLLVGRETSVPADRVRALLSHEIGTHLVTRHNGSLQPMQLLQSGLAGYDTLQEGLAILAEYLVGGLSTNRIRLLAARVVATHARIEGADFRESLRLLVERHGFEPPTAYTVVLRVFRGGGLTKDAAYLRGLDQVIRYLAKGGELEPLLLGKLAVTHIPLIRELIHREVLHPPAILPRYFTAKSTAAKLAHLRSTGSVVELTKQVLAETGSSTQPSQRRARPG